MKAVKIIIAVAVIGIAYVQYDHYQAYAAKQPVEVQDAQVYNSTYDGSVKQVEAWFDKNLDDPASFERVEWSKVSKTAEGNFVVRCKYRAKNKSGAVELQDKVFILGSTGIVLAVKDYQA